jgi:hypothetical protein
MRVEPAYEDCRRLRNSTTKLIHPTAIVSKPITMQSLDVAEYVPATIQITPAPIIPRETRYASTLSFMPSLLILRAEVILSVRTQLPIIAEIAVALG